MRKHPDNIHRMCNWTVVLYPIPF